MAVTVVMGKTLENAREFAEKYGLENVKLISPWSFNFRCGELSKLGVARYYVTRETFERYDAIKAVMTLQRFMQKTKGD